ncbi:MAG: hypothetical protein IPJ40_20295 [Saprospirales bacterium]|nr:hypothetical protein [Saprospirales bacterium]
MRTGRKEPSTSPSKDDKKQGYFGNVTGGYGTDSRYQGKASINRFSKKMQLSAGHAQQHQRAGFLHQRLPQLLWEAYRKNMMAGGGCIPHIHRWQPERHPLDFGQHDGITTTTAGNLNFEPRPQ